jgi:Tfp pilus assembly protein PilO
MKKSIGESGRVIIGVVAIVVLAAAFYLVLLQPKRDKASELSRRETAIATEVAAEQSAAGTAEAAKKQFPADYRQLVQLGKAVPSESETPSLLVQLNGLSAGVHASFKSISLGAEGGAEGEEPVVAEGSEASALPPLGAAAGPSGLLAMPYSLEFEGGFFDLARFLRRLDSQVSTNGGKVSAKGRLLMVDGFSLAPISDGGENASGSTLSANLSVDTYVTPPGQGITAGATAAGPAATSFEGTEASPELTEVPPEETTE